MSKTLTINIPSSVYNKIQNGSYLKALAHSTTDHVRAIYEWWMHEKLLSHSEYPSVRKGSQKLSEKAIRDLVIIDMQPIDKVILCIDISLKDEFWKEQILSLASLRKTCKDGLSKYEHLLQKVLKQKPTETRSDFGSFKLL